MVSPRRRPRHNRNAEPIASILSRVLHHRGFSSTLAHREVFSAWHRVVPTAVGERTRPVSFRGGVLTVIVESAPLMEELRCFRAGEFLTLLNGELSEAACTVAVRKVIFRRS